MTDIDLLGRAAYEAYRQTTCGWAPIGHAATAHYAIHLTRPCGHGPDATGQPGVTLSCTTCTAEARMRDADHRVAPSVCATCGDVNAVGIAAVRALPAEEAAG